MPTASLADTVAWWHFDERDPGTTAPANTVASDQAPTTYATPYSFAGATATANSGDYLPTYANPFHGRPVYDPVTDTTRANRAAMRFTTGNTSGNAGRAYYGGSLSVPSHSLYTSLYGTSALTVEAFVCTTGGVYNSFAPIVGSVGGKSWTNERWALYMQSDGTLALRFAAGSSSADVWYSGNSAGGKAKVNDGSWHHVAFTYDGSNLRIYVDYVLDKKSDNSDRVYEKTGNLPTYSNDNATWIGGYNTYDSSNGGRRFPGLIDEVRVSNATLAPSQFLRFVNPPDTDKDAVLHLRFNESASALENGDVVDGTVGGLQAIYYAVSGADASSFDPAEKAGTAVAGGLYAASSTADTASFQQSTNATGKANYIKVANATDALFPDGAPSGTNLNYTVEAFFKARGSEHQVRRNVIKFGTNYLPAQFCTGDEGHPNRLDFCFRKGTDKEWTTIGTPDSINYHDGNWHHVALVSDASNRLIRAYFDYALVGQATDVYVPVAKSYSLFVGARENGTDQYFDGWIDDVRVTKRALAPEEFLTTHPVGPGTKPLLTALLEQDYSFTCATDSYWSVTGVGEARTGGMMPVFQNISRGALLLDGTNGNVSAENAWSARMDGSRIIFPASLFYEQDNYTVEFWAKFDGFKDKNGNDYTGDHLFDGESSHAGILRFVQGNTTTFDWYLYRQSRNPSSFQIAVRRANNTVDYKTFKLNRQIADGKWHHYAVEVARNEDNTSASVLLYADYEPLSYSDEAPAIPQTFAGFYTGATSHRLMVCESSGDNNPGVIGNIDAIRLWRGNPAPSQFLGRAPNAFTIVVR